MSQGLMQVNPVNVTGLGTIAATTTSAVTNLGLCDAYAIVFDASSVTGTSPTCDIVMQVSYDGGTTYINAPLRSAQITAAGVHWNVMRRGLGWGEAALTQAGVADTGGAVNKNFVFDPRYVKFKATIGGTNPSFNLKIHIFGIPLGTNGAI